MSRFSRFVIYRLVKQHGDVVNVNLVSICLNNDININNKVLTM